MRKTSKESNRSEKYSNFDLLNDTDYKNMPIKVSKLPNLRKTSPSDRSEHAKYEVHHIGKNQLMKMMKN